MPELEFIGNWEPTEAQAIAAQFQQTLLAKSLGVGDGGGAEVSVQQLEDNPIQSMLSKRQKRLIELLRQAGAKTFEGAGLEKSAGDLGDDDHICGPDCAHSWNDYGLDTSLLKAVGSLKRDAQGRTYKMNANRRWERFGGGGGGGGALPEFGFPPTDGAFGRGVYFPVVEASQGYLRLRVRANLSGSELIGDEEFHALETDFAADINEVLDSKGVRGIVQTEGQVVTLLCVRSPSDLQVLGAVADSGQLPPGPDYEYRLVKLTPADDHIVVDVEVSPVRAAIAPQGNELIKAAKVFSGSPLSGTVLTPVSGPQLDRVMLRQAVERCKLDGVPVGDVAIALVDGVPDYLPPDTSVYCLPSQGTIYIAHHDLEASVGLRLRMLTRELRSAARVGAIPSDLALEVLLAAQEVDGQWWLEHHIKRYTGAILAARVHDITTAEDVGPWGRYVGLLAARGLSHWGSRRAIAECIAEDYRCAHDPAGFPNEVTMLWDLAVPAIARMAQQELLNVLRGGPMAKAAIGSTKTEGGITYRLNQNHRWERTGEAIAPGQMSLLGMLPPDEPAKPAPPDPLTAIDLATVLQVEPPSAAAQQFLAALKSTFDPVGTLEMVLPSNRTTAEIEKEYSTAKKAVEAFQKYGIKNISEIENLFDTVDEAIAGRAQLPPITEATNLFQAIMNACQGLPADPAPVKTAQVAWNWLISETAENMKGHALEQQDRLDPERLEVDPLTPEQQEKIESEVELLNRLASSAIQNPLKELLRFSGDPPGDFDEFESLDDAIAYLKQAEVARHPNIRAIGELLDRDEADSENARFWFDDEASRV